MINTTQTLKVHINIGDVNIIDDVVKANLNAFLGKCHNSMIVATIDKYSYRQDYIDIMSELCGLTFKVTFEAKCYRYYTGDFIWIMVTKVDELSYVLQNPYCNCYMLKNISNNFLSLGDYAIVRIMEPIYPNGELFTSRVEMYNPIPIVSKVIFHGPRSETFKELVTQLESLITNLSTPDDIH